MFKRYAKGGKVKKKKSKSFRLLQENKLPKAKTEKFKENIKERFMTKP